MPRIIHNTNSKSKFIINLFRKYQPELSVVEQLKLLSNWIESCVLDEEYEMADVLVKEKIHIEKNMNKIPHRKGGELNFVKILNHNPLFPNRDKKMVDSDNVKTTNNFWSRLVMWVKSIF